MVLATDGLANVGVGRMDEGDLVSAKQLYIEAGETCRLNGTTVDVLALGDENTGLSCICAVSDFTGGTITRAAQLLLLAKEKEERDVLGSQVLVMALLPRQLRFDKEADDEREARNWLVKDVGVARAGDSIAFGFAAREHEAEQARAVFQVQTVWKRSDGAVMLRVCSASLRSDGVKPDAQVEAQRAAQLVERLLKAGLAQEARREIDQALQRLKSIGAPGQHAELLGLKQLLDAGADAASDQVVQQCARLKRSCT